MSEDRENPVESLTGLQKAAIVLMALEPAESAAILKNIPEEEADRIARVIARLEQVTPQQVQGALEEFNQYATSHQLYLRGGLEYARRLLEEAYGGKVADRLIQRLITAIGRESANFDNFRKTDPLQLAKLIQDEHPQTIALILSHLHPAQAATLISSLPVQTRTDVAIRMADLNQISPEIVRNIASVIDQKLIDQKLRNLGELSTEAYGGVHAVANMFNRLDPNTCSQLLDAVEAENASLFENIRKLMFVFRDLEELDPISLKSLVDKVDRKLLTLALKGANESLRQKILQTQSSRGAEMLVDDIASLGPVKLREVDEAQQKIIAIARELEKEGIISLKSAPNDQYVY
jgi:flagellar motor switch protein FliG